MAHRIAIVGLGINFPESTTKEEFLANILARRAQFREYPSCRLPLDLYYSPDRSEPDKTYCKFGSFITDFKYDHVEKMVPMQTFQSTDTIQYIVLDTADKALKDAEQNGHQIDMERAMVVVGNTLAGENSRTESMRLRWPYVEKAFREACKAHHLQDKFCDEFSPVFKEFFQSAFSPVTPEDTLPGSMSNTIAGRVAGEYGIKGGAFAMDAACASGLLAVCFSCDQLTKRTVDFVIAGGADMSLDTFESIGFAKVGALTDDSEMKVYDSAGKGFIPGEGCGVVVLKRLEDVKPHEKVYGVIEGWGFSSDGTRTITRPSENGEAAAFKQACTMAGKDPKYSFVEGHGTGTAVGDDIEILAIHKVLASYKGVEKCGLSSLKSLFGHTKAASGIGALIKTALCLSTHVVPPTRGISTPHKRFEQAHCVYPVQNGHIVEGDMYAGCQAMGFGGINVHTFLSSPPRDTEVSVPLPYSTTALMASWQDSEFFILSAHTAGELLNTAKKLTSDLGNLSVAELTDLSYHLAKTHANDTTTQFRASVVAGSVDALKSHLVKLQQILLTKEIPCGQILSEGALLLARHSTDSAPPRVAFIFPGNGSWVLGCARDLVKRFPELQAACQRADSYLQASGFKPISDILLRNFDRGTKQQQNIWMQELNDPIILQPCIILAELLYYIYLTACLQIVPSVVVGHSLGELMAFYVAGAFDEKTLILMAALRGRAVAQVVTPSSMMRLKCDEATATKLCLAFNRTTEKCSITVANSNHPTQTIVSGTKRDLQQFCIFAQQSKVDCKMLSISHGFHSPLMAPAMEFFAINFSMISPIARRTAVTIITGSGTEINDTLSVNIKEHFTQHLGSPVKFVEAIAVLQTKSNFLIEVGPGTVLTGILGALPTPLECHPVESKQGCCRSMCSIMAHAHAHKFPVNFLSPFTNRLVRPFTPPAQRAFFVNPCERTLSANLSTVIPIGRDIQLATVPDVPEPNKPKRNATMQSRDGMLFQTEMDTYQALKKHKKTHSFADPAANSGVWINSLTQRTNLSLEQVSQAVLEAVSALSHFAIDKINADHHVDHELHMDSDKVISLVNTVQEKFGAPGLVNGRIYSNSTLRDISSSLYQALTTGTTEAQTGGMYWVRNFIEAWIDTPLPPPAPVLSENASILLVHHARDEKYAEQLRESLNLVFSGAMVCTPHNVPATITDTTVLVVLLPSAIQQQSNKLMDSAKYTLELLLQAVSLLKQNSKILFLQDAAVNSPVDSMHCATAFAASLHLERPKLWVRVLTTPRTCSCSYMSRIIYTELFTVGHYQQAFYTESSRKVPVVKYSDPANYKHRITFSSGDLAIVLGGGKGITAQCAIKFGQESGCNRFALLGRSESANETEQNFANAGLDAIYYSCDVTHPESVHKTISKIQRDFNSNISILIHGAATLHLRSLADLSLHTALEEISPKIYGFQNIMEALGPSHNLRLVCALTSIIGVSGMPGNSIYAYANQSLERVMRAHFTNTPVQFISIAFSVWDEMGMGVNTGAVHSLRQLGIRAITALEGSQRFADLACYKPEADQVIVSARYEDHGIDTWHPYFLPPPVVENKKFVDSIVLFRDGIEIITSISLSVGAHPYLADHVWKGEILMPAVMCMEAMHQAVCLLFRDSAKYQVEIQEVKLLSRIKVPRDSQTVLHVWAVLEERRDKRVVFSCGIDAVVQESATKSTHTTAKIELVAKQNAPATRFDIIDRAKRGYLPISPKWDLYSSGILFHGSYFHKIQKIISAKVCTKHSPGEILFKSTLDKTGFLLSDPSVRDAAMQAVQVVVDAHQPCLPTSIKRLCINERTLPQDVYILVTVKWDENELVCQAITVDTEGQVIEEMIDLTLKFIHGVSVDSSLPTLSDLLEPTKRDSDLLTQGLHKNAYLMAVEPPTLLLSYTHGVDSRESDITVRHSQQMQFITAAFPGHTLKWQGRKPMLDPEDVQISITHDRRVCIYAVGENEQGCDIVPIKPHIAASPSNQKSGKDELEVAILVRHGNSFLTRTGDGYHLLSFCIKFTRGPKRAITVVVNQPPSLNIDAHTSVSMGHGIPQYQDSLMRTRVPNAHDVNSRSSYFFANMGPTSRDLFTGFPVQLFSVHPYVRQGTQNQPTMRFTFPLTFQQITGLSRTASEAVLDECIGKAREIALWQQYHTMSSTQYTLVTTDQHFEILGEVYLTDVLEVSLWQQKMTGAFDSTSRLIFDVLKICSGGEMTRVTRGEIGFAYAKELERGKLELTPLTNQPDNEGNTKLSFFPPIDDSNSPNLATFPLAHELFAGMSRGETLFKALGADAPSHNGKPLLFCYAFKTDLYSSNFVQGIYYSNYLKWAAQARDSFFFNLQPDVYTHHRPKTGEFILLDVKITHVLEALPFDDLVARMFLVTEFECGVDLYFEFHKKAPNGKEAFLCYAKQQLVWASREPSTNVARPNPPSPTPLPASYRAAFANFK